MKKIILILALICSACGPADSFEVEGAVYGRCVVRTDTGNVVIDFVSPRRTALDGGFVEPLPESAYWPSCDGGAP